MWTKITNDKKTWPENNQEVLLCWHDSIFVPTTRIWQDFDDKPEISFSGLPGIDVYSGLYWMLLPELPKESAQMAEKTFTRWTSHTPEEAIESLFDNRKDEVVFCDEEQLEYCKQINGKAYEWSGIVESMCDTCHEVKIMIRVEDV